MSNLARNVALSVVLLTGAMVAGCSVSISTGPGPKVNTLLDVSSRAIPDSGILAFQFVASSDRRVTISVQANTDLADPDFEVVDGVVDAADRDEVPLGDVLLIAADRNGGDEEASFVPDLYGTYTLFISDRNELNIARFSVTVTQSETVIQD